MAAMSNFIVVLDMTIANVSIPHIAAGLGVSPREGAWVITSYAVAEAIMVPLSGWLAVRFGPARALVAAIAGFGTASVLCGMSTSIQWLVFCRVLQGLAGGPMMPLSQTLLFIMFPPERRGTGMAVWTMTSVLGPICGPVIGGQICEHWNWHWIFFINVPVVIFVAMSCWRLLAHRDPPPQKQPVDSVGVGLMVTWIGAIQFMLDRGHDLDWLGSPLIVTTLIVGVVGFVAFLMWELTEDHPIINLRIFRHRGYSVLTAAISLGFGAFFGSIIIQPLWLQTNMDYTAEWAGFAAAPTGLMMFMISPLVAWLTNRMDARILSSAGLFAFALALVWRAGFASNVTFELIVASQLLNGICLCFFVAPAMSMAMAVLRPQEIAEGAAVLSFIRTAAIAFSTALTTTAWQDAATRHRVGLVDRFDTGNALDQMAALGLPHDATIRVLDGLVQNQAVMLATNHAYMLFAVAMALGGALVWLSPRVRISAGPAPH
jgi:DHA2 family multidrug resistance protein